MSFQFFDKIKENIERVSNEETQKIVTLSEMLYEAVVNKQSIYIFGAGHAGIISCEMYYRAGGFMLFNPIFPRELSIDNEPITITSQIERLEGYGRVIAMKANFKTNDLLIVHSVSGRNSAGIDVALVAKENGAHVVAITNLEYSKSVSSRHSSGKRLYEVSDLIIDNHGVIGDAICELEGSQQKVASSSTIIATVILNEAITQLAQRLVDEGLKDLPFFTSANLDGGDQKNENLYKIYRDQIHYRYK
ncbi:hypothetical protein AOC36_08165 [Erysipelothrix larvae]|uniref:SIS domain-containing protein n=2 Tax=Erysipelothrix larvae TaxID=1514105 RepID=A0A0X8H2A8_9FIRM|nr:hypothetical protein AOC36_08165 [Erysipelothrix larvae]